MYICVLAVPTVYAALNSPYINELTYQSSVY